MDPRADGRTPHPDLLVAFGVDRALAVGQMGFSVRHQGKPPDFVLEVASPTTGRRDYTQKRNDYAAFSIPEYWRFDPSGGRHYDASLAGDRLYISPQLHGTGSPGVGFLRPLSFPFSPVIALWHRSTRDPQDTTYIHTKLSRVSGDPRERRKGKGPASPRQEIGLIFVVTRELPHANVEGTKLCGGDDDGSSA